MAQILRRAAVFFALVALGVGAYLWLERSKEPPRKRGAGRERGTAVRVVTVAATEVVPRVTGYGVVRAHRAWQGTAQVGGTIIEVAPGLEVGRVVREGTVLFRIDPDSYELERSRSEATVRAVEAQLAEIKTRIAGAQASLKVENSLLALAKKDLARVRQLRAQGLNASVEEEAAERAVLNAEKAVNAIKVTLAQLPASRKVLEAQLAQQQSGVKGAEMNVERTVVVAPFTMRVRQVGATLHQAVGSGALLLVGESEDLMEVPAHLPVGAIGALLGPRAPEPPQAALEAAAVDAEAPPGEVERPEGDEAAAADDAKDDAPAEDAERAEAEPEAPGGATAEAASAPEDNAPSSWSRRTSQIQAKIKLSSQGVTAEWEGRFRRFEGIDPDTRTQVVVVEVERPERGARRGGPPLRAGMHVEVELSGAPRTGCLSIPRAALRGDTVHVVDAERRLALRKVEVDLVQEAFVCVASGLAEGDQVVVSQLQPAVAGMLLEPRGADGSGGARRPAGARGRPGAGERGDGTSRAVPGGARGADGDGAARPSGRRGERPAAPAAP